jgi:hypothetical protein
LKIKLWFNGKKKKKRNWFARDKKLFIFIFESQACCTIKRDTMKPSKVIRVFKPLAKHFIL